MTELLQTIGVFAFIIVLLLFGIVAIIKSIKEWEKAYLQRVKAEERFWEELMKWDKEGRL